MEVGKEVKTKEHRFNLNMVFLRLGVDSFAHHVSSWDWNSDRSFIPGHWQRGQEGPQQFRVPVLLNVVPHVRSFDAHRPHM